MVTKESTNEEENDNDAPEVRVISRASQRRRRRRNQPSSQTTIDLNDDVVSEISPQKRKIEEVTNDITIEPKTKKVRINATVDINEASEVDLNDNTEEDSSQQRSPEKSEISAPTTPVVSRKNTAGTRRRRAARKLETSEEEEQQSQPQQSQKSQKDEETFDSEVIDSGQIIQTLIRSALLDQIDRQLIPVLQSLFRVEIVDVSSIPQIQSALSTIITSDLSLHAIVAASKIQGIYRMHSAQQRYIEEISAILLQSVIRQILVSDASHMKNLPAYTQLLQAVICEAAVEKPDLTWVFPLQALICKSSEHLETQSLEIIQSTIRVQQTKASVYRERNAAATIQRSYRKHVAHQKYLEMKSAIRLQTVIRYIITQSEEAIQSKLKETEITQSLVRMRSEPDSQELVRTIQNTSMTHLCIEDYLLAKVTDRIQRHARNSFALETTGIVEAFPAITLIQGLFRMHDTKMDLQNEHNSASVIQKAYRDYVIYNKYLQAKTADRLQRQIRQVFSLPPCDTYDNVILLQSVFRLHCNTPELYSVPALQSCVRLNIVRLTIENEHLAASIIQKKYRDYVVYRRYLTAKSIDRLQRQIRHGLVTMPGGITDEMRNKHSDQIAEKEVELTTFGSRFVKGFQKIWTSIAGSTPSKKRSRIEMDLISSPSPTKRRRLDEQYERRMTELTLAHGEELDRAKQIELERTKMDNELMKALYEEREKSRKPSADVTPTKQKVTQEDLNFIRTPKEKLTTPRMSLSDAFSFASPLLFSSSKKRRTLRAEPVTKKLPLEMRELIYPSAEPSSESNEQTGFKRPRSLFESTDEEYSLKRPRIEVSSPGTEEEPVLFSTKAKRRVVQWRDGFDKRSDETAPGLSGVEDTHDFQFSPHHNHVSEEAILGILKSPPAKNDRQLMFPRRRPPVFPTQSPNNENADKYL